MMVRGQANNNDKTLRDTDDGFSMYMASTGRLAGKQTACLLLCFVFHSSDCSHCSQRHQHSRIADDQGFFCVSSFSLFHIVCLFLQRTRMPSATSVTSSMSQAARRLHAAQQRLHALEAAQHLPGNKTKQLLCLVLFLKLVLCLISFAVVVLLSAVGCALPSHRRCASPDPQTGAPSHRRSRPRPRARLGSTCKQKKREQTTIVLTTTKSRPILPTCCRCTLLLIALLSKALCSPPLLATSLFLLWYLFVFFSLLFVSDQIQTQCRSVSSHVAAHIGCPGAVLAKPHATFDVSLPFNRTASKTVSIGGKTIGISFTASYLVGTNLNCKNPQVPS
jgi:hypothetical protein